MEATTTDQLLLDAIAAFRASHGYPPSVRELADLTGVSSPSTVHRRITSLTRKGLIRHSPRRARSIVPATDAKDLC